MVVRGAVVVMGAGVVVCVGGRRLPAGGWGREAEESGSDCELKADGRAGKTWLKVALGMGARAGPPPQNSADCSGAQL